MPKYLVIPERSRVSANAKSSVHPIRVETAGFEGYLDADVANGEVRLGTPTHIELPVELLKSNNSLIDGELQKRLEARKFPFIKGDLREAKQIDGRKWKLSGDLTLHGTKQPMDVEVTLRAGADGTIEVEGEKTIDMRDFGLQPPKMLFLSVDPAVRIRALLVAKQG